MADQRLNALLIFGNETTKKAIRELGLRIPEDISIVGYDNMPFDDYTEPPLTSVKENTDKLGEKAVELLLDNERTAYIRELVIPSLVIRSSTAIAPGE